MVIWTRNRSTVTVATADADTDTGAGAVGDGSACAPRGTSDTCGVGVTAGTTIATRRRLDGASDFGLKRASMSSTSFLLRPRASVRTARWFSSESTPRKIRTAVTFNDPSASQASTIGYRRTTLAAAARFHAASSEYPSTS